MEMSLSLIERDLTKISQNIRSHWNIRRTVHSCTYPSISISGRNSENYRVCWPCFQYGFSIAVLAHDGRIFIPVDANEDTGAASQGW